MTGTAGVTGFTLFHAPNSCSEGIALLLRVIGVAHENRVVDLAQRAQQAPAYRAVNPKGKVPALLRPDGTVLTEFPAIAFWLARQFPAAGLIGEGLEAEARALELVDFIVSSLHMRGFTLIKVPQKFLPDAAAQDALRAHGRAEVDRGLDHLADQLGEQPFLLGRFGIADAAAFYVLRWAEQEGIAMRPELTALLRRIEALG